MKQHGFIIALTAVLAWHSPAFAEKLDAINPGASICATDKSVIAAFGGESAAESVEQLFGGALAAQAVTKCFGCTTDTGGFKNITSWAHCGLCLDGTDPTFGRKICHCTGCCRYFCPPGSACEDDCMEQCPVGAGCGNDI